MATRDAQGIALSARVLRALAVAPSTVVARESVLREIAQAFDWPLSILWTLDEATGLLVWAGDWSEDPAVEPVRRLSRRLSFAPDVGLPGAAFAWSAARVVDDFGAEPDLPRAEAVLEAGLRSAVAVPIVGREGAVGVLELFARSHGAPTSERVETLTLIGHQVAEYLGRVRVEERLRATEESSAAIVDAALDCIITMDHRGRVLDMNRAAEATFGFDRDDAVGQLLADLVIPPELRAAHQTALASYVEHRQATILNRRLELTALRADGTAFPVELTVTRLGTGEPPVFAGFLRDITERREAQQELERLLAREHEARLRAEGAERDVRTVAGALQASLLPPELPAIPRVELGAAYRAGSDGWQVGGDFYDVFQLSADRWGLVVGDVCGKGPQAASATAIVRYALRAAAMRHEHPSGVLRALNEALVDDPRAGGVFTAVYATIDVGVGDPVLRLASGGHPPPLLLRADGSVQRIGLPGTVLGGFPSIAAHDTDLNLAAGETLLFYTDGVTEAKTLDGRFGSERLEVLLAELSGLEAGAVATRVEAAVSELADAVSDDIAVVALRTRLAQAPSGRP